ncbi:MAG: hypothetical protein HQL77_10320 [Magnetococcales bacterium]|nr:hypothetical protein [Magnetococcales bacterium]
MKRIFKLALLVLALAPVLHVSNGMAACGSSWNNPLIPDKYPFQISDIFSSSGFHLGYADFKDVCRDHDYCYNGTSSNNTGSTYWTWTKSACDNALLNNAIAVCNKDSALSSSGKKNCVSFVNSALKAGLSNSVIDSSFCTAFKNARSATAKKLNINGYSPVCN